jgi:hypothetical protein
MEKLIVGLIVGLAVIYLAKRYLGIFRSQAENRCACGCSDCGQASTCSADAKSIHPHL